MGIVDDDRRAGRRRGRRYTLEAAAHRLEIANTGLDRVASDADDDRRADRCHPIREIRRAEEIRLDADVADRSEQLPAQAVDGYPEAGRGSDAGVAHAEGDRVAEVVDETAAVRIVAVDDRGACVRDLIEEDSLRGAVVV